MLCPDCQHPNDDAAKFCGQCGTGLGLNCPQCGANCPPTHKFCSQCGAALETTRPASLPAAKERAEPRAREERRWATVLFADLSDFTKMSERMDAEDVKRLADRCTERMSEEVRRFGGTVLNVVGDQVVAVFGAPQAHEDDAERAVRAGLAIRDCPLTEDPAHPIKLHVGINTGELMAGSMGSEEQRKYTVMGDTVNMAARLMSAAPSGSVLVGEETWRATRRVARYRELPPVAVKGKERPLPVWEALDAAASYSRPLGTAPLVGREEELALLSGIWLKAVRERRPHLVTVLGEPGIGKSRLVAEFERRFCADALVLHGRCLPYGEALGYWALTMVLKEAAGITAEAGADTARLKLTDLVSRAIKSESEPPNLDNDPVEVSRHLALLSGLDTTPDRSSKPADQRTLHASVRRFLEALARPKPLCLIFEDIHWADAALLDLIEFVASRTKEAPLLIVAQARPGLLEKRPNWGGGVRTFTSLSLEPLSESSGRELILALCRERGLAESLAGQVGRGAGGNPLFAEELVAMAAERGTETGIPSAIKVLIAARLDALPPAQRHALQLAAVFGKMFWAGGLGALGGYRDVTEQLEALEQRDLLRLQPHSQFRNEREYAFKHDLIRDVAYEMLPRSERKILHGRVADWIEQAADEHLETYLDQLAHHTLLAGQEERALDYLIQAAERARRSAAHPEEAALLAQAIPLAERLQRPALAAELHARRGTAFMSVAKWTEARPEFESALAGLPAESLELRTKVLVELAGVRFWTLDVSGARRCTTEALALAEQINRDDLAAGALSWFATCEQCDGNMESADNLFRRAIVRDTGICIAPYALFPLNLYLSGKVGEAIEISRQSVQRFRGEKDTSATMFGLPHVGLALAAGGQYDEALRIFEEGRRFGHEYGIWPFLSRSISMSAGLHLDLFDYAGNEALAEEARERGRSSSGGFMPSVISSGIDLLLNYARRHEVGRAEKLLNETMVSAAQTGGWHAWLWNLRLAQARAEIALARGDWEEAVRLAADTVAQSHARKRVKYHILALWARARALDALGRRHEAIADLQEALALARPMGDPALLLRPALTLLGIAGDDALLAAARGTARRILSALSEEVLRQRFQEAEPVRILGNLSG